jgi:hypothetical protein
VEASAGVFTRIDFGNICRQESDVVSCGRAAFMGLSLAPRWRLSRPFSVGAYGAWGWANAADNVGSDGSHEDFGIALWRLEAEGRWHPLGIHAVDPWVGVDGGVTGLRDSVSKYVAGGQFARSASVTQLGPVAGLGLGLDFHLLSVLAIGLETRVSLQSFGHSPPLLLPEEQIYGQDYGTVVAWSVGLTGTLLAGPRPEPEPAD